VAKTPKQKGPRPSPRRATDDWHVNLARLLEPLTPEQRDTLSAIFKERKEDATSLLQDWKRISEIAHYVALDVQTRHDAARLLINDRDTSNRRDAQLRKAAIAAGATAKALKEMVTLWSKHVDAPSPAALSAWADQVTVVLAQQREAIEQYRTRARKRPRVPLKTGRPEEPATYRLKVLAAYFRRHGWEVSSKEHSLFAELAVTVTTGNPLKHARLKAAVASRYSYTTLAAKAPSIAAEDRRLHAAWAR
jgi:hypothetical protein